MTDLAPHDARHGTNTGYMNWGCRCDPCRAAYAEWRASRKDPVGVACFTESPGNPELAAALKEMTEAEIGAVCSRILEAHGARKREPTEADSLATLSGGSVLAAPLREVGPVPNPRTAA